MLVEIEGMAVVDASGVAHSLDLANRDGFQRVGDLVMQNTHALPRAYVLPRAQAFSPGRHPGLTATQLVASPDVDLHTMLLIEGDPRHAQEPSGSQPAVAASQIQDVGPNSVRVTAVADAPSYVVLDDFYHRGWTARVDGQPARVLYRQRAVPSGGHRARCTRGRVPFRAAVAPAGGACVRHQPRPRAQRHGHWIHSRTIHVSSPSIANRSKNS